MTLNKINKIFYCWWYDVRLTCLNKDFLLTYLLWLLLMRSGRYMYVCVESVVVDICNSSSGHYSHHHHHHHHQQQQQQQARRGYLRSPFYPEPYPATAADCVVNLTAPGRVSLFYLCKSKLKLFYWLLLNAKVKLKWFWVILLLLLLCTSRYMHFFILLYGLFYGFTSLICKLNNSRKMRVLQLILFSAQTFGTTVGKAMSKRITSIVL